MNKALYLGGFLSLSSVAPDKSCLVLSHLFLNEYPDKVRHEDTERAPGNRRRSRPVGEESYEFSGSIARSRDTPELCALRTSPHLFQGQGRPLPTTMTRTCVRTRTGTRTRFYGRKWALHVVTIAFYLSLPLSLSVSLIPRLCANNSSDPADELVKVTRGKVVAGRQLQNREFLGKQAAGSNPAIDSAATRRDDLRKDRED